MHPCVLQFTRDSLAALNLEVRNEIILVLAEFYPSARLLIPLSPCILPTGLTEVGLVLPVR